MENLYEVKSASHHGILQLLVLSQTDAAVFKIAMIFEAKSKTFEFV